MRDLPVYNYGVNWIMLYHRYAMVSLPNYPGLEIGDHGPHADTNRPVAMVEILRYSLECQ